MVDNFISKEALDLSLTVWYKTKILATKFGFVPDWLNYGDLVLII